jgi:hypothetical protein
MMLLQRHANDTKIARVLVIAAATKPMGSQPYHQTS